LVTVAIELFGEDRFVRAFNRIASDEDLSVPLASIYEDFTAMNNRTFIGAGYPKHWVALSAKYEAWKRANYPNSPIMVLRGDLKASLASEGGPGMGEGAIREIHPQDAYFGTSIRYAAAHQWGYPPHNLPQRKVVQITDPDKVRWGQIIQRWYVRKLKAATVEGGATPA